MLDKQLADTLKPESEAGQKALEYLTLAGDNSDPVTAVDALSVLREEFPDNPLLEKAYTAAAQKIVENNGRKLVMDVQLMEAVQDDDDDAGVPKRWSARLVKAGRSLNYRIYPSEVLQQATPLFEGVKCYADHPGMWDEGRSVKDVVGWFEGATWNENEGAVDATFNILTSSPLASALSEAHARGKTDLFGLSLYGRGEASLQTVEGEQLYVVEKITAIDSVDLVSEPAAGGGLLAVAESAAIAMYESISNHKVPIVEENEKMPVEETTIVESEEQVVEEARVVPPAPEMKDIPVAPEIAPVMEQDNGEIKDAIREMKELERKAQLRECNQVLREKLAASGLPTPIQDKLRAEYENTIFETKKLDADITLEKDIYARIVEETRKTPITVGENDLDRKAKALQGLFERKTIDGIRPYRSLHESYCDFNGISYWDMDKSKLADLIISDMATATNPRNRLSESISWSNALGTTLHRMLVKDYQIPSLEGWRNIASSIRDLNDMKAHYANRIGYYSTLSTVNAGGVYQEPSSPSDVQATLTPAKYGRLESYTWENALDDDIGALVLIPKRLALAAKLTLYKAFFDLFQDNSATTYDSVTWFNDTHSNKGNAALGGDAVEDAIAAMRSQTALSASSLALSIKPKYLLVGPALEATAKRIRDGQFYYDSGSSIYVPNAARGEFEIMVIDYWTSNTTYWFMVADPATCPTVEVGFLNGREEPELMMEASNSGSGFTSDKIYMKVRFVFGLAVVDHRGVYGYLG